MQLERQNIPLTVLNYALWDSCVLTTTFCTVYVPRQSVALKAPQDPVPTMLERTGNDW
jgi:hypothetical protein